MHQIRIILCFMEDFPGILGNQTVLPGSWWEPGNGDSVETGNQRSSSARAAIWALLSSLRADMTRTAASV